MLPDLSSADCYSILGVPSHASNEQIKTAYKRLALQWHPDRHVEDKEYAAEHFVEVSNAYRSVMRERRSHYQDSREVPAGYTPTSPRLASFPVPNGMENAPYSRNTSTDSSSTQDSSYNVQAKDLGGDSYYIHTLPYQQGTTPSYPSAKKSERYDPAPTPIPRKMALPTENCQRKDSYHRNADSTAKSERNPARKRGSVPLYEGTKTDLQPQDIPAEWIFYLHLTLEELFKGKSCRFQLTRNLRSGRQKEAVVEFRIPPGSHHGTRFVCRGVGHERGDGSVQDVVFVVDELRHDHFQRMDDDLLLTVSVPWPEFIRAGYQIFAQGVDGQRYCIQPPQSRRTIIKGVRTITGAGMPMSEGEKVIGRGDLIICWEVAHPSASRWDGIRRALHLRR